MDLGWLSRNHRQMRLKNRLLLFCHLRPYHAVDRHREGRRRRRGSSTACWRLVQSRVQCDFWHVLVCSVFAFSVEEGGYIEGERAHGKRGGLAKCVQRIAARDKQKEQRKGAKKKRWKHSRKFKKENTPPNSSSHPSEAGGGGWLAPTSGSICLRSSRIGTDPSPPSAGRGALLL